MIRNSKVLASTFLGAGLALSTMTAPALAQDATYLHTNASHCEIFRSLSRLVPSYCAQPGDIERPAVRTRGIQTRSIRLHDEKPEADVAAQEPADLPEQKVTAVEQSNAPDELAFAMRVQFEYDSFRLTDDARQVLDKIAGVLNDELMQDKVVEIEGHADAHGPDAYNLSLSQLRARSVRAYLMQEHGVAPQRLQFVGKGETEPYNPQDPYDGVNRRVEFQNVTG